MRHGLGPNIRKLPRPSCYDLHAHDVGRLQVISSGQDLASVLLVVAFDLDALGEFVWLTRDLIELSEGYGECHELVFHFVSNFSFVEQIVKQFF